MSPHARISASKERTLDRTELRELGFLDELIDPAEHLAKRGAFDIEPPHALVEQTLNACLQALGSPDKAGIDVVPGLNAALVWQTIRESAAELSRLGRVPAAYADGLFYLSCNSEPPLVMVENHNLVTPMLWNQQEFTPIREACHLVNHAARSIDRPVSFRVVVLKPDFSEYTKEEVGQIDALAREATSDVYWISQRAAGKYALKDTVVVGDLHVLSISDKPQSAHEAEQMLVRSKKEDSSQALKIRTEIEALAVLAVRVKSHGEFTGEFGALLSGSGPEGTSAAIKQVLGANAGIYDGDLKA
jgi:hypothetical protein